MYKNYLLTAYRNLRRNKSYTLINIAGLATGIAVCLLVFTIIRFESGFDNFHPKKDRIFRVLSEYHHPDAGGVFYGQEVPYPVPTALHHDFPQLEKVSGIYQATDEQILVLDNKGQTLKKFKESTGVFSVEPAFFDIFHFPWLAGNPATALNDPNSAVLTKEIAEKYFGDWKQALGQSIKLDDRYLLKVTGVLATIPANTDFQIRVVVPYSLNEFSKSTDWVSTNGGHGCYFLMPPGMSEASMNTAIRAFSKKYRPADAKDELAIQSLTKVHTDSHINNFIGTTIKPGIIQALWLIGAFILLIACVNFINLSTAQAVNRAREVGVRKVLGSNKWQLKTQFLVETLLLVIAATILALGITRLALPGIGKILDLPLSFAMLNNPVFFLYLFLLTIVVTLLAGFYPSIVLSGFNPINALKSRQAAKSAAWGGLSLRKGLVVTQFIIAQALIIGTLIIVKQMDFFRNSPMGFDKEAIVNVPFQADSIGRTKIDYLRNQLAATNGIQRISFNSNGPATEENNWSTFTYNHAVKQTEFFVINKFVDSDYLKTYNLTLVAGTNFHASDSVTEFIVSEETVRRLGIAHPGEAVNKEVNLWGSLIGRITGVIKDFHSTSLKDAYTSILLVKFKRGYSNVGIKLAAQNIPTTLASIERLWNKTFPNYVFEYEFLDARIDRFYKAEHQLSRLYKLFAGLAIFLSCLGLYGLASFMAEQRIREVGIRKVLGATVSNIVYLFSKEFITLIGIAFLIAAPIAWYFMHNWLQNYVYRTPISWWIFVLAGFSAVAIALISVSFQAIKAAIANPVKSLRSE
jgi:putative ABC transport system permease protein